MFWILHLLNFTLDHRLQSDCTEVCDLELCKLLLLNDARWPWLILVPRVLSCTEIHNLPNHAQHQLNVETAMCAQILTQIGPCTKINTGALGNIVRQLHVHVIARNEGDDNWPGPVWGFGTRRAYLDVERDQLIDTVLEKLKINQHD